MRRENIVFCAATPAPLRESVEMTKIKLEFYTCHIIMIDMLRQCIFCAIVLAG